MRYPRRQLLLQTSHRTTPLGLDPTAHVDRFYLERGDRVRFYTDDLFEVGRHPIGRLLEITDRILRRPGLENAIDDLIAELVGDQSAIDDDVAVLLMEHRSSLKSSTNLHAL
jgi:Stage II sporulation protein E (SpoIIE)